MLLSNNKHQINNMGENKYTFILIESKQYKEFQDKNTQDLLVKWSMKGHISLQTYCFNEPFLSYKKKHFVLAFFQDPIVKSTLNVLSLDGSWHPVGTTATSVDVEHIPCTATTMSMFNCLKDPSNDIAKDNGILMQCLYDEIDGFPMADELRKMLLDPESQNYNLIPESMRNEFLFRLFKHLCLGGQWCQYEDNLNVYIDITKKFYKDIIKVQKDPKTKEIIPVSIVLKVIARGKDNVAYLPSDPENEQNFVYLIVDPICRQITTLIHQYRGMFEC